MTVKIHVVLGAKKKLKKILSRYSIDEHERY